MYQKYHFIQAGKKNAEKCQFALRLLLDFTMYKDTKRSLLVKIKYAHRLIHRRTNPEA